MVEFINKIRFSIKMNQFVADPKKTEKVFDMFKIGMDTFPLEHFQCTIDRANTVDAYKKQVKDKYFPKMFKEKLLEKMPESSTGKALYNFIQKNKLDFNFYPDIEINNEVEYFTSRMYQVHDLWHVLTGYGTSLKEELALQGFTFAQTESGGPIAILATGLLHFAEKHPEELGDAVEAIMEGYNRGKQTPLILSKCTDELLEMPIEKAREELKVAS